MASFGLPRDSARGAQSATRADALPRDSASGWFDRPMRWPPVQEGETLSITIPAVEVHEVIAIDL